MDFWEERLRRYNGIEWVRRSDLTEHVLAKLRLARDDVLIDLGCGTGVLSHLAAPLIQRVIGVDSSLEMVRYACEGMAANESFIRSDAAETPLRDQYFTRAVLRMTLHHNELPLGVVVEAHRLLARGGVIVVCEGVPPSDDPVVVEHYAGTMLMKEHRYFHDYPRLLRDAGFDEVGSEHVWLRGMSTRDWCYTSMVPPDVARAICRRRIDAPRVVRDAYNMRVEHGDPIVDTRFVIVTGMKPA